MIMCTISIRTQFSCSFFSKPRIYLLGAAAHGTEDTGGAEAFVVLGVIGLYTWSLREYEPWNGKHDFFAQPFSDVILHSEKIVLVKSSGQVDRSPENYWLKPKITQKWEDKS